MATKSNRTVRYTEPLNFFPEEVRKANKLGEFADKPKTTTEKAKTAPKKATNADTTKGVKGKK